MLEKVLRLIKLLQSEDSDLKVALVSSVHKVLDSAIRVAEKAKAVRQKEADKIIKGI